MKKLTAIIFAALLTLSLAGCASDSNTTSGGGNTSAAQSSDNAGAGNEASTPEGDTEGEGTEGEGEGEPEGEGTEGEGDAAFEVPEGTTVAEAIEELKANLDVCVDGINETLAEVLDLAETDPDALTEEYAAEITAKMEALQEGSAAKIDAYTTYLQNYEDMTDEEKTAYEECQTYMQEKAMSVVEMMTQFANVVAEAQAAG